MKAVNIGGVNNGGNMNRGPMMYTSDIYLPKDDKITMLSEQITARKLTELWMHGNANYATRKLKAWYGEEDSSLTPRWLPQVEGEM